MAHWMTPSFSPLVLSLLVLSGIQPSLSQSSRDGCSVVMVIDREFPSDCSTSLPSPPSSTLNCSQLQHALTALDPADLVGKSDPVCVLLTSGKHLISYTDMQVEYDVHIEGVGANQTQVECLQNASFNNDIYEEFPLKFGGNTSVLIEGLSFAGCGRPLLFNGTANVTIQHSHFSQFNQTATEIYATPLVTIFNSTFTNNTCYGQGKIRSSGNAGAVSIGYNDTYPRENSPLIRIVNCTFIDNSAKLLTSQCGSVIAALFQKLYVERGGAVGCYFSAAGLQSEVHISGSHFRGNVANDSGGGIYMNLNGRDGAATNITISDSQFIENRAMHGAGVEITFDSSESVRFPNSLTIERCRFEGNRGIQGGGMKLPQISQEGNLNSMLISDCQFVGNYAETGAAVHIETFLIGLLIDPVFNTRRINIHSGVFSNNAGKRGIVFLSSNHANFRGDNLFATNTGPSLRVKGSLASLEGTFRFQDNKNHHEGLSGAMFVSSSSQLLLNPGVNITFTGNIGLEGAAIVVRTPRISSGFARTLYNPQCFLQFSDPTVPPVKWADHNVSIYFEDNEAIVGPVLFITNLDACSWFDFSGDYFNIDIVQTWHFATAGVNYVWRGNSKEVHPELYVQTQLETLRLGNSTLSAQCSEEGGTKVCAYPGQSIPVNVTALDQFKHTTTAFLRVSQNQPTQATRVDFTPSIAQTASDNEGIKVAYNYNSSDTMENTLIVVNINPAFSSVASSASFPLYPISCPPGYHLDRDLHTCHCEESEEVLACDPKMEFVLLNDGLWGGPPQWSRSLVTYPCPPTYCDCTGSPNDNTIEGCALIFNDASISCTDNRTGVLCGECIPPYGVGMLTLRCREFTAAVNMYYWLIPMQVIFIVVVVAIIVKVGVALPSYLLGFLLYIQISTLAVASFSQPFRLNTDVMSCVTSFLALYVPFDFSLHSGLSALEAYGLRFISPVLALLVVPVAAAIKFHPRSWTGIWTLLLLMYGMTVETSSSLLFCPTFTTSASNTSHSSITVWFYDGSVPCYEGPHLGLALLSLLFLLLSALLVPLVSVLAYHREVSCKFRVLDRRSLEKLSISLTSRYHSHARWWLPLELARRLILIMSVIFCPGYVSLPLLEAGLLLALSWFVQPYRDWKANVTEAFSVGMLVLLLCLGNTNPLVDLGRERAVTLWPVFYFPLAVTLVINASFAGWKIWKCKPIDVIRRLVMRWRVRSEEGEVGRERRFTERLTMRRTVKTTEVGLEDSEEVELTDL